MLTKSELRDLQRGMNAFTTRFLYRVAVLVVDGDRGKHTDDRIQMVKWYLGYEGARNSAANTIFRSRLWHPTSEEYSSAERLKRAEGRRAKQRKDAKANEHHAHQNTGVGRYDGVPVANWMVPYLDWARHHGGWSGRLVSGWRDPVYSEQLCLRMCGRTSCSGLCAGRSSNHSGSAKPHGAVDVSDYYAFGQAMRRCPLSPRLTNHLPRDLVHWSVSGG